MIHIDEENQVIHHRLYLIVHLCPNLRRCYIYREEKKSEKCCCCDEDGDEKYLINFQMNHSNLGEDLYLDNEQITLGIFMPIVSSRNICFQSNKQI